jgi:SAM-dependent methyltransferase
VTAWDGDEYQRRFDALAASGADVHGEATFVAAYQPASVLDAGCGTGRVAIELARRGVEVVGIDADPSMLETARSRAPAVRWVGADVTDPDLDLGGRFDLVVMAGNVPLFTRPGTTAALVAGCARHLRDAGLLVAGFQLGPKYPIEQYDAEAGAAGLELVERFASWDREPFAGGDYAVSVHRRPVVG